MIARFVKTYATALIIVAIIAGLAAFGGSYVWVYGRGKAIERAVCDATIATKTNQAIEETRSNNEAGLDAIEVELKLQATVRANQFDPPSELPAIAPSREMCALTLGQADAINNARQPLSAPGRLRHGGEENLRRGEEPLCRSEMFGGHT